MVRDQIANALYCVTTEAMEQALTAMHKSGVQEKPDWVYVGLSGIAGTLMASSILVAAPDFPKGIENLSNEEKKELIARFINPETLLFMALLSVTCIDRINNKNIEVSMGPEQYWEALRMWEKLKPGLDAAKYIEPELVFAARLMGDSSAQVFKDFLKRNDTSSGSMN